jgi:mRNA interferase ChpB
MRRGDIYLVSLDPTAGQKHQGTRPVLVVSPDAFNALTRVPIVLPITSGGAFARSAGFAVSLMGAGTRTTGVVHCDQPRPIDILCSEWKTVEHQIKELTEQLERIPRSSQQPEVKAPVTATHSRI